MNKIEVEIVSVSEESTRQEGELRRFYLLLFREKGGARMMPVFIGEMEARSILLAMNGVRTERPLVYDLMLSVLEGNGMRLTEVRVVRKVGAVYHAEVVVVSGEVEGVYDSRTSDVVALALRVGAPIYVDDAILEELRDTVRVRHTERAPVGVLDDDELDDMLERAIAVEDYERASEIRDEKRRRGV